MRNLPFTLNRLHDGALEIAVWVWTYHYCISCFDPARIENPVDHGTHVRHRPTEIRGVEEEKARRCAEEEKYVSHMSDCGQKIIALGERRTGMLTRLLSRNTVIGLAKKEKCQNVSERELNSQFDMLLKKKAKRKKPVRHFELTSRGWSARNFSVSPSLGGSKLRKVRSWNIGYVSIF